MGRNLEGQICVVTGASQGIGRAASIAFAREGAHIVAIARNKPKLEQLDDEIASFGGSCTLVPLDITEFEKIDQLGGILHEKFGMVDIFIGNAAILGSLSPVAHVSPKIWQKVIDTNLNANFRFLRSFDELFRKSTHAHIIFLTAQRLVQKNVPFWSAYSASKAALENLASIYAAENKRFNISVNCLDPGDVATALRKEAMPGEDQSKLITPEEAALKILQLVANTK